MADRTTHRRGRTAPPPAGDGAGHPDRDVAAAAEGTAAPGSSPNGPAGRRARHRATVAKRIEEVAERKAEALQGGGAQAIERQHARGKLTARERLELLLDPGSFVETDALVRHRLGTYGLDDQRPYTDGVITGWGTIDGRKVFVFSQDFTVFGGSFGEAFAE